MSDDDACTLRLESAIQNTDGRVGDAPIAADPDVLLAERSLDERLWRIIRSLDR